MKRAKKNHIPLLADMASWSGTAMKGQTLVRAFRIDENLPLESQPDLTASSFTGQPAQLTLTAEQYRFKLKK